MTDLERAREFFAADRYATEATGIEIVAVGEHYAKCELKIEGHHKNAVGHVMGGVMFTMADFVFAVATNFDAPSPTVTVTSNICYLASPRGNTLYGEAKLLKDGKRNCFYEITITDDTGTTAAIVTVSGAHLSQ
jgi:acyl-CoA thioesterase